MNPALDLIMPVASEAYKRCIGFTDNFTITGSLAYNKDRVTLNSDLEILSIVDFHSLDTRGLFNNLGISEDRVPLEYLVQGRVNALRMAVPSIRSFEVNLTLWDELAF